MRGFIYTITITLLAISFMYVLAVQNSIQGLPRQDYDTLVVSNYYRMQASMNNTATSYDYDYNKVIENYKILKNHE